MFRGVETTTQQHVNFDRGCLFSVRRRKQSTARGRRVRDSPGCPWRWTTCDNAQKEKDGFQWTIGTCLRGCIYNVSSIQYMFDSISIIWYYKRSMIYEFIYLLHIDITNNILIYIYIYILFDTILNIYLNMT